MHGIVMVKETKSNAQKIERVFASLLEFILSTPSPKAFLKESKFTISSEGCVMRGRNCDTKEIKSMHVVAGQTTLREGRIFFSY
jgi:hypothetical protein